MPFLLGLLQISPGFSFNHLSSSGDVTSKILSSGPFDCFYFEISVCHYLFVCVLLLFSVVLFFFLHVKHQCIIWKYFAELIGISYAVCCQIGRNISHENEAFGKTLGCFHVHPAQKRKIADTICFLRV